ncbi:MAG: phosphate acyltransferase PlsX [Anaerolineales bacterium]
MRIALDGMGTDHYPGAEAEGAVLAAREFGCEMILTGDETLLAPALAAHQTPATRDRVRIVHSPEHLAMGEKPAFASRRKSNNSMARGMQLVRDGEADAFVTAGNTGAALTNALLVLKRISGAKRPALTVMLPTATGSTIVLDIGANADCKPEYLYQFGVMGSVYAEKVLQIDRPQVGLLANGEEAGKGNALVREVFPLLAEAPVNFVGNIEPQALFAGKADVVVTDGYTGNILIKSAESVAALVGDLIKGAFKSNPLAMAGGALARSALRQAGRRMDPTEYGGVPLLGVNGVVIVGHGRSNGRAIRSAIGVAIRAVEQNIVGEIRSVLSERLVAVQTQAAA